MKMLKEWWGPVAGVAGLLEIRKSVSSGWQVAELLIAAVLVSVFVTWLISLVRRLRRVPNAFALLAEQAHLLVLEYKQLQADFPVESRLPLKPSSWPDFGQVWLFQHVRLCRLSGSFADLQDFGGAALQQIGNRAPAHWLDQSQSVSMTLLINALEHFRDEMKALANAKIAISRAASA